MTFPLIPPDSLPFAPEIIAFVMFAALFSLLLAGYPVAFTLGGVAFFFGILFCDPIIFKDLPIRVWGIMDNKILIAVPLFIYMGVILQKSGLAEELLDTMALLFGRLRGGLALSVIVVGALLAASTGIVGATVVTMGLLTLPTMLKRGYSPEVSCGTIAASGTLGQIIPPSIALILLGDVLIVPVGDMFKAAMIPGLILVVLYIMWIIYLTIVRPDSVPAMPADELAQFHGRAMITRIVKAFLPPLLLIVAVLGAILKGVASPTEAAAVGALGATILTACHGRLKLAILKDVMRDTTYLTCMVFMILVGARAFTMIFGELGGNDYLKELISNSNVSPVVFLLLVMVMIFLAGFFIDFIEIIYIIVPVLGPIFKDVMHMDLLWIGVLLAMNLQTSFLTPPFGFSLFYLKGVAPPEVTTGHIYRGIVPFIIIQLVALALVAAFPELALWLPRWLD